MSRPRRNRSMLGHGRRPAAVAAATFVLAAMVLVGPGRPSLARPTGEPAGTTSTPPGTDDDGSRDADGGGAEPDVTTITTLPPGVDGDDTLPPVPSDVTEATEVYRTVEGQQLSVRIFRSRRATGDAPAVVVVHGGGWYSGDAATMDPWSGLLAEAGWVAFAVDYRLAAQGGGSPSWPAALEDVKAGVEWVHDNAGRYGADPGRLAVFGESAGAHLTVLVAEQGTGGDAVVRAAAAWSAPLDLAPLAPAPDGTVPGCAGDTSCEEFWRLGSADGGGGPVVWFLGCEPTACPRTYAAASPLGQVDDATAPLWFANSTDELVPLPPAEQLAEQLAGSGVDHELVVVRGQAHAHGYGEAVWNDMVPWLAGQLDVPTPPPAPFPGGDGDRAARVAGAVGAGVVVLVAAVVVATVVERRRHRDEQAT